MEFTKKRIIAGSIVSFLLLLLVVLETGTFINKDVPFGALLYALTIFCSLLIGFILSFRIVKIKPHIKTVLNTILAFLLPIVSMTMVECLNSVFIYDYYYVDFINSYLLYLLFYGLFYAITGSYRLSIMVFTPVLFIFGLANYYIYKFKGSPFVPMDFASIGTAKEVASSYDFSITYQIIISTVLLTAVMCIGFKLQTPRMHLPAKIISRVTCGVAMLGVCFVFFFSDIFANCGLEPDFWNQTRGYHRSGFLLNFCLNTKYTYINSPSGYNADETEQLISEFLNSGDKAAAAVTNADSNTESDKNSQTPNVISVMCESFSDLSVCGDFKTNVDYMPFYRSLKENTIKGNLYVPVHGSGTSNTEYEFLTGNSMSFFPAGSNAFSLYIKDERPSIVSTLGSLGYTKTAFHPYYSSGWNRRNVYSFFGFDSFYSITSTIRSSILIDYINSGNNNEYFNSLCEATYPGQNVLARQYVSDSYDVDKVISYYEDRDTSKPFFMFNVTMQNHGGYGGSFSNFINEVKLTSTKGSYPKTEQYLSLVKKTDEAIEKLITYFKNVDEPTVICFFGDHQPNIEEEFYAEIMGVKNLYSLSKEQQIKRYITPFFIWANYDINEESDRSISSNYLSSYMLKVAGIKQTEYNKYLNALSEKVPVITSVGYIGDDGKLYSNGERSSYTKYLEAYEKIQYNNAIDKKNQKKSIFYLQSAK